MSSEKLLLNLQIIFSQVSTHDQASDEKKKTTHRLLFRGSIKYGWCSVDAPEGAGDEELSCEASDRLQGNKPAVIS